MHRLLLPALLLAACNKEEPAPEPGALEVGYARARIPAPLGIGTAGFGPFGAPSSNSPYANLYPATKSIHGHPEIKVAVISRGEGFEAVFIRYDTVGVFQQLRRALVLELQDRMGRDLDDAIILGATHTHSGPGRIIDAGGPFDIIADSFFPEFYERLVDTTADTVEAAYADLAPGRIGTGHAWSPDGASDRRCEDGEDYVNGDIPLIALEQEGELRALIMAYAIHGTSLGIDDLHLSQDVSGAIEQAVEDRFDAEVPVIEFNSWGADMAPGSPAVPSQDGAEAWAGAYDRMEQIGWAVGEAVHATLDAGLTWDEAPDIDLRTLRVPIDREAIGYDDDTFDYDNGGVYCEGESDCDPSTTVEGLDESCLPFPDDFPAPHQTLFTVGRLGALELVTFPGEPGTKLAEQVLADIGASDPIFLGYTQDYIGYSILEDDWWQGGYEASGAIWGPRQGSYLAERAVDAWGAWTEGVDLADDPGPIEPFDESDYTPIQAEQALSEGSVLEDVPAQVGLTELVTFTFAGWDPWLGAPLATLESADGSPVLRANGAPVDSDDYRFRWDLAVDPSYDDADAPTARTFAWTLSFPVQHVTPDNLDLAPGSYRVRVLGPATNGGGIELLSGDFEVLAE
ncbi:MAG: neutral/alkaline non-lysosomal ceramidase N-terminal domain-containing protein [Alphaproteobacteria bacterium]|nr:neutral/alkaline non-lysosomal ceramidase N-terminal domain-containing protein [Alphaproteobacteria bacterium]